MGEWGAHFDIEWPLAPAQRIQKFDTEHDAARQIYHSPVKPALIFFWAAPRICICQSILRGTQGGRESEGRGGTLPQRHLLALRAHFKAGGSWNCPGLIGGCNSGEEFHSPIRFSVRQNKTINLKLNCTAEMLFTLKPWRNLLNHHYLNRDAHNENQKNEMLNEKKKKSNLRRKPESGTPKPIKA